MKPNTLNSHLETVHTECAGKIPECFHRKLNEFNKQKQIFAKITIFTSEPWFSLLKFAYTIARVQFYLLLLIQWKQCLVRHLTKNFREPHLPITPWEEEYRTFLNTLWSSNWSK